MTNTIDAYFRDHILLVGDLLAEREPRRGFGTILGHFEALKERFGESGAERIVERARALAREVFGGAGAPQPARLPRNPWYLVDADMNAELLVKECRDNGVRPSTDSEWLDKVNKRWAAMAERHHLQRLQQRAQPKALPPAPPAEADVSEYVVAALEYGIAAQSRWQSLVPVSEVEALGRKAFGLGYEAYRRAVDHIVRSAAAAALGVPLAPDPVSDLEADRALTPETAKALREYAATIAADIVKREAKAAEGRAVETRSADDDPPLRWRGIWQAGKTYRHGDCATRDGMLWFARIQTDARPGDDGNTGWQLMHKAMVRDSRAGRSERAAARELAAARTTV